MVSTEKVATGIGIEARGGVDGPQQEDVTERAVRSFHGVWALLYEAFTAGTYVAAGAVARARTGVAIPMFNGVWGRERHVTAAEVLSAIDEFAAGDLPWNLQLRPGYPEELNHELAERGLSVTAEIPFMTLRDPSRLAAAVTPAAGSLRRVQSFRDIDSTLRLLEEGMGCRAS